MRPAHTDMLLAVITVTLLVCSCIANEDALRTNDTRSSHQTLVCGHRLPLLSLHQSRGRQLQMLNTQWERFKAKFNKVYTSIAEERLRRSIWEAKTANIDFHNRDYDLGQRRFRLELNFFSDMTHSEVHQRYKGFRRTVRGPRGSRRQFIAPPNSLLPDSVDWLESGYVTNVKNQLACGSCWAFSATGALEGQLFKATGNLKELSEQNLVDCSFNQGNSGCNGGLSSNAFNYVRENGGLALESDYQYTGEDRDGCQTGVTLYRFNVSDIITIESGNEQSLKAAVATIGPISVAIDANHESFMSYSSGIFHESACSSTNLDHAVLLVGYGTAKNGEEYWLIKNSWGTEWGDNGYIRMARNQNNMCGIATEADYPVISRVSGAPSRQYRRFPT